MWLPRHSAGLRCHSAVNDAAKEASTLFLAAASWSAVASLGATPLSRAGESSTAQVAFFLPSTAVSPGQRLAPCPSATALHDAVASLNPPPPIRRPTRRRRELEKRPAANRFGHHACSVLIQIFDSLFRCLDGARDERGVVCGQERDAGEDEEGEDADHGSRNGRIDH